jgi:hypothetical protein
VARTWCEAAGGGDWTIAQAKQVFGGSASQLAAAFSGVDSSQKGYSKDTGFQSALRQLNRWNAAQTAPPIGSLPEGERRKQTRQISAKQQKKLNDTVRAHQRRGRPLGQVRINGKLEVNDSDTERRPRTINKPINWRMVDRLGAIACAGKDGEARAWAAFSVWYNEGEEGVSIKPAGVVDITIS